MRVEEGLRAAKAVDALRRIALDGAIAKRERVCVWLWRRYG